MGETPVPGNVIGSEYQHINRPRQPQEFNVPLKYLPPREHSTTLRANFMLPNRENYTDWPQPTDK